MLNWGNRFNICCFLDNHNYHSSHNSIECILAAGVYRSVSTQAGNAFAELHSFYKNENDWLFGHFGYDLKNETEELTSSHFDGIQLPDLFFFIPQVVIKLTASEIIIGSFSNDHQQILEDISALVHKPESFSKHSKGVSVSNRYTKKEYIETVEKLKAHILRGDCYEINLCQEFYAENIAIDPLELYLSLSNFSPNPFSAYYRINDICICCMSPERYLRKEGDHILSQPMKGTSRRDSDPVQDAISLHSLRNSEKEKAENIMVVDLVRNDLSRISKEGTVKVDELCTIYSFPQVHQMISTVSGTLKKDIPWTDAIKATFPMGSMTGAPKKKVMELIEKYERTRRGVFSGSIGYINPDGDFDFNVVIRSVLYNATARYLSFHTGSAITFSSDAEKEYEECMLKAGAIKKALAETSTFY